MYRHAAEIFTAHEMLLAYTAERLERMAELMYRSGHSRLGLLGSREHARWLCAHIEGMKNLPIVAYIDRPDRRDEPTDIGVPVFQIDDAALADAVDCVLIADDRCEDALFALAERHLPGRIRLHRLYNRLPIGNETLAGSSPLNGEPKLVLHTFDDADTWRDADDAGAKADARLSRLANALR